MLDSRQEYTNEEKVRRGQRAEAILADEVFDSAIEQARFSFYEEWIGTSDEREQYAAWAKTHGLEVIVQELRVIISEGEVAASIRDR